MIQTNRISINAIGKIKKPWINQGINLYIKRMPGLLIEEYKNFKPINFKNNPKKVIISLTEEGTSFTSSDFSSLLLSFKNKKVLFLIGDTDGLPHDIKFNSDLLLSLSPFTFPHELARLILIEQIYRSVTISQNLPYHRS